MQKTNKHPPLTRPSWGCYGRNEIGILGAPCDILLDWVDRIVSGCEASLSITYLDADHQSAAHKSLGRLTDKIAYHEHRYNSVLNEYDQRLVLSQEDLVIVNSNHFDTKRQIVFCSETKKESLRRKLERLGDVTMVILDRGIEKPHDFLHSHITTSTPIIDIDDISKAIDHISHLITQAPVRGLILAGGRSTRMGVDKASISYHGRPQVDHLWDIMSALKIETRISCREEQVDQYGDRALVDTFRNMGPYGAIMSAFKEDPNVAWLVIACDLPLLSLQHVEELISKRQATKVATCYYNELTGWPDPLFALWEPKAYNRLLGFMGLGYNCPRKVLINSDIHMIKDGDTDRLMNANSPEDRKRIMEILHPKRSDAYRR